MHQLKLGVRFESLGLSLRAGLQRIASMGVGGVQLDAVGDLSPNRLTDTGRRELRNLLRSHHLELAALGCPLRRGLDQAEDQEPRIDHVRKVMTLSCDLGANRIVLEAGRAPSTEELNDPRAALLIEALSDLSKHGDRIGALIALVTGSESGEQLRDFIDRFDSGSLGADLDPANLLLNGFNVMAGVSALQGKIHHAHARDGRVGKADRTAREVPLGHGDIDWMSFLASLQEAEYRGPLVVDRGTGEQKIADIEAGIGFLRRFIY